MKFKSLFLILFFATIFSANAKDKFSLKSPDIKENSTITNKYVYNGFGCKGKNISPELSWNNAPQGTKSFAITVYDPDAPTGSGWWHYIAVNIPASYKSLEQGFAAADDFNAKDGINQIKNDFGTYNFGGPCPPKGSKDHHYIFTIYALGVEKLEVPENASAAMAGFMINHNSLSKASFTAIYKR